MLLSSDIGGARMFVKVAPVRPDLAFNENLIVRSRSFVSRARMPDENFAKRQRLCRPVESVALDAPRRATLPLGAGAVGARWRFTLWSSACAAQSPKRGRGTGTSLGQAYGF